MSTVLTKYAMVSYSRDENGKKTKMSEPAICAWLNADMDEKKALMDYLRKFGTVGTAAFQILLAEDPRTFSHRPSYQGWDVVRESEHGDFMDEIRERYGVKY